MIEVKRDDKGYPLLDDGTIDWELTSIEKQAELDKFEFLDGRKHKIRHKPTNYTPPKKKRK